MNRDNEKPARQFGPFGGIDSNGLLNVRLTS